ncbi:MAG: hypothetical protein RLZ70_506 [Verrucomicrobiota bacterium]|jgi:hypothetical protein
MSSRLSLLVLAPLAAVAADGVSFNRDIQPILSEYCYHCHGPDAGSRKAKLRLDRPEFAFQPAKSGDVVILKGAADKSPLIQRILNKDPDEVMPPPESHKQLKPAEIELLRRWVNEGAKYEEHWAFLPPQRPVPPTDKTGWAKSPIDAFIIASLTQNGLKPNGPEAKERLFRRLNLDLTGLPPTPEELRAYLADNSPDAYAKAVERLLKTDEHAEQMARHWLDAVRYADTHGIHIDNIRNIYPYRDWVIDAFKTNMPFDRFTIEQIGGDLLPNPTIEQIVATGYNRCLPTTGEGGAIAEEVMTNYAKDQVETLGAVWLGLTSGCAACHDHKFDPISQKEFYAMAAFFRNTSMSALDGNNANHPPSMLVPQPEDRPKLAGLEATLANLKAEDAARKAKADREFAAWRLKANPSDIVGKDLPAGWSFDAATPLTVKAPTGPALKSKVIGKAAYNKRQGGFVLDGSSAFEHADLGDFEKNQAWAVQVRLKMTKTVNGAVLGRMDEANGYRGWDFWIENGNPAMHIIQNWSGQALKVRSAGVIPLNKEVEVIVTYDGSGKAEGVKFYIDGDLQANLVDNNTLPPNASIRTKTPFRYGTRSKAGATDIVLVSANIIPASVETADVATLGKVPALRSALGKEGAKAPAATIALLRGYYDKRIDKSDQSVLAKIKSTTAEIDAIKNRGAMTLIMKENATPATAKLLIRGEYTQPAETVPAGTPRVLPPLKVEGKSANRLDLARWLVDGRNPMTARVTMNRLWYQFMGTGLSETTENVGIMGDKPSHPELLDWLATEFVAQKWDQRAMVRAIVLSETYRQSGVTTPEKLEKDPKNRLLSRGPRYRVDAEIVRDLALSTAGLLVKKVGGPSVRPYQPENIWSDVAMTQSNTRFYKADKGDGLYRRSMYTFLKRSAPHPMMLNFDATSREVFCTRRERSNSPLQSLNLMNDVQFIEASRVLAERLLKEQPTDAARIDQLSLLLLSRPATAKEHQIFAKSLAAFRADYAAKPAEAVKLLKSGEKPADPKLPPNEVAAWTLVCSQMFNRDETLNK